MRPAALAVSALALLLVGGACATEDGGDEAYTPPAPADGDMGGDGQQDAAAPVCLQGEGFVADGEIHVRRDGSGDASRIRDLRWERHEGCERFVVDLGEGDADAGAPPAGVGAEVLRDLGLVRVTLPGVRQVTPEAVDRSFDGPLAREAYAVWAPDGRSTYVDLHLAEAAEARASVLRDPARVVVDLRPGGGALPEPPPKDDRVVVLAPRPGEASYPLRVVGYARTFEANVVVRLEQGGEEALETFTTATSWADAWGFFELTLEDGPTGPVELHVGEYSARDGTWEGAAIDLQVRPTASAGGRAAAPARSGTRSSRSGTAD